MGIRVDSSEFKRQFQLGKDLARAKEYKKAEQVFLKLLKDHQLADLYNSLGLVYADTGEFTAAEFCFEKALKINPNYMEAALNLSVHYNNLGEGKKSKDIYKKLAKYGASGRGAMDPLLMSKIANLYGEIGGLFHGVGEYKLAIKAYQDAIDLMPNYLDIQTKLATALRESGKKAQSIKHFEKLKRKAQKFAPFWTALGVTYYASNRLKDAKRAWEKAIKIDPKNASAKAYLKLNFDSKPKKVTKKKLPRRKKR